MKIFVFVYLISFTFAQSNEEERISRLKCEEYNELSITNNICNDSELLQLDGIVKFKEYPFVGALGFGNTHKKNEIEWVCSGTLISEQFVLTTAHCTFTPERIPVKYVQFGTPDLSVQDSNIQTYIVYEVIVHPDYNVYNYTSTNDIALLKLDKPVEFTEYIQPACLYTGQDLPKYNVAGFSFRSKNFERRKGILLHEITSVASKEICNEKYQPEDFDKQFCVEEGIVSCEINSGAPLLYKEEELRCMQSVAGIVQLGRAVCDVALNVKVSGFIDWIENIVWL